MPPPFGPFGFQVPGYNPANWYWEIRSILGFVFSSARASWVPTTDATYLAWLANPWAPTIVPNLGALVQTLAQAGLTQAATAAAIDPTNLVAVQTYYLGLLATKRYNIESGGMNFNGAVIPTDDRGRANVDAVSLAATRDPTFVLNSWKVANGVYITLNATQIVALGNALLAFVQACFDNEKALSAQINAAAGIVAIQAIDITTGWPASAVANPATA